MADLILAVDPGSVTHGAVLYDPTPGEERPLYWASKEATTEEICTRMRDLWEGGHSFRLVVERVMAQQYAANSLLRTAEHGAWMMCEGHACGVETMWMPRSKVLTELHISGGSRDKQVRDRMIELHGGCKEVAVGKKASPGPLHGVTSHAWQALGVAVAAQRRYAREGLWA